MERGTLDDQIQNSKATGARLPLINKAAWCFQMASVIAYTHFTAHTCYINIKPANLIMNSRKEQRCVPSRRKPTALGTSKRREPVLHIRGDQIQRSQSWCTKSTVPRSKPCLGPTQVEHSSTLEGSFFRGLEGSRDF